MGIWFATTTLGAHESVVYRSVANLFRDRRQINGQLTVTERRLLFAPSRLGVLHGGEFVTIALDTVTELQLAKPGRAAVRQRGAGASRRYQVEIATSDRMIAVTVRDHDALMRAISAPRHS